MRTRVDYRSANKNNYKDFCKNHPNISIFFDEWVSVIYGFNNLFREHILETGERMKLPAGLGDFSIKKKKQKKTIVKDGRTYITLSRDWVKTMERGKAIYNFNYHTEGYSFHWIWFRKSGIIKHRDLWYFKPCRSTSRMLCHYLKINNEYQHKYREWTNKD
jgi:hypothetical protein